MWGTKQHLHTYDMKCKCWYVRYKAILTYIVWVGIGNNWCKVIPTCMVWRVSIGVRYYLRVWYDRWVLVQSNTYMYGMMGGYWCKVILVCIVWQVGIGNNWCKVILTCRIDWNTWIFYSWVKAKLIHLKTTWVKVKLLFKSTWSKSRSKSTTLRNNNKIMSNIV